MKRLMYFVLLAACGDNLAHKDDDNRRPDAAQISPVPLPRAVAAAGDYGSPGTGVLSRLDISTLAMSENVVPAVAQGDPVLRVYDGKLYVINRFGSNNITILNASTLGFENQISTGANSNPQDVAVVGDKLYIPALGTAGVLVLGPGAAMKTIDLSALDTVGANDGKPECISAYAVDTRVFVACGVLDGFSASEPAKVAVIDTATDTVTSSFALTYSNPYGHFERAPVGSKYDGALLLPTVPDYTSYTTGCLEQVTTGATPSASCAVSNADLGGFVNAVSPAADGSVLYVAVGTYDSSFKNPTGILKGVDLADGTVWTAPLTPPSQMIVDVAACPEGDFVTTDQTFNNSGLRVWRGTAERTTAAQPIGMPPTVNALVCYDAR
jgi:hypothetical protein